MNLTENFTLAEFACHDGSPTPDAVVESLRVLAQNLEHLRSYLGRPISITSGYRTAEYNGRVGGAALSQHILGRAADIRINGVEPEDVHEAIEGLIRAGKMVEGGLGLYKSWVHYDTRGTHARWHG